MLGYTLIDGNNLLHAMHAHAPVPHVGRETLVRIVERWAYRGEQRVTLIFDGAAPKGELARQMSSRRIKVLFAAPQTADDVLVDKLHHARNPQAVSVVSDDGAIAHEARRRRAIPMGCRTFIEMLFAPDADENAGLADGTAKVGSDAEKPTSVSEDEISHWVDLFDDAGPQDDLEYR